MEKIEIEYRGFQIVFCEQSDEWRERSGSVKPDVSLKKVKGRVDTLAKAETSIEKQLAIFSLNYFNNEFCEVTVTSKANGDEEYWISRNKQRNKVPATRLFAVSDENKARIAGMMRLNDEVISINSRIKAIFNEMTPFAPSK